MLLNCDEVKPYIGWVPPFNNIICIEDVLEKNCGFTLCTKCCITFTEQIQTAHPNVSDADVDTIIETHFVDWPSQNISNWIYSLKIISTQLWGNLYLGVSSFGVII